MRHDSSFPPGTRASSATWLTAAAVAATAAVVAAALAPWVQTGAVTRNGFAIARSARDIGIVEGSLRRVLPAFYATPLLTGIALLAFALGRPRIVAAAAAVAGIVGVAAGLLVLKNSALSVDLGPKVSVAAGCVALALATLLTAKART